MKRFVQAEHRHPCAGARVQVLEYQLLSRPPRHERIEVFLLLREEGFDVRPAGSLFDQSAYIVARRGVRFLEIPIGNGTVR